MAASDQIPGIEIGEMLGADRLLRLHQEHGNIFTDVAASALEAWLKRTTFERSLAYLAVLEAGDGRRDPAVDQILDRDASAAVADLHVSLRDL
jgi:hypothetical protein